MSNLKDKVKDRQKRMDKAMGDGDYAEDFNEAASLKDLKAKKKELETSWKRTKKSGLLIKINELDRKIMKMEGKL